jgi:hypothetical protein
MSVMECSPDSGAGIIGWKGAFAIPLHAATVGSTAVQCLHPPVKGLASRRSCFRLSSLFKDG